MYSCRIYVYIYTKPQIPHKGTASWSTNERD